MQTKKRILVMGGSYFIGRVFCILASRAEGYDITVVNRGTYALNKPNIAERRCDRNDLPALRALLTGERFDATIDFCALREGDAASLLEILGQNAGQYIHIGSCSVLAPSAAARAEHAPYARACDLLEYSQVKLSNERDTLACCTRQKIAYTVLRPCFVYGPFNYAPRESFYFKHIFAGKPFPHPVDCNAQFSFVYVTDIANAILAAIGNPAACGETFHLAAPEALTYDSYLRTLEAVCEEVVLHEDVTLAQVRAQNIPIPFPIDANELFDGSKITQVLGLRYTPFAEGMQKTYQVFKPVYQK